MVVRIVIASVLIVLGGLASSPLIERTAHYAFLSPPLEMHPKARDLPLNDCSFDLGACRISRSGIISFPDDPGPATYYFIVNDAGASVGGESFVTMTTVAFKGQVFQQAAEPAHSWQNT